MTTINAHPRRLHRIFRTTLTAALAVFVTAAFTLWAWNSVAVPLTDLGTLEFRHALAAVLALGSLVALRSFIERSFAR